MDRAARPTYELRTGAWKLIADQDPQTLYQGRDPQPNITAIAECAGLSSPNLIKFKNGQQPLTFEIFNCLTNLLVTYGWDRLEAQEALFKPLRFASRRKLVAA